MNSPYKLKRPGLRQNQLLIPREKRLKARALFAEGYPLRKIAEEVGISVSSVVKVTKRLRNKFEKAEESATATALERVKETTKENVLLSAAILNKHLKHLSGDDERIADLSAQEANYYASIGEKEFQKMRLQDGQATQILERAEYSNTDVNVMVRKVAEVDILSQAIEVNDSRSIDEGPDRPALEVESIPWVRDGETSERGPEMQGAAARGADPDSEGRVLGREEGASDPVREKLR